MGKKYYCYVCKECGSRIKSITRPFGVPRCPDCGSIEPKDEREEDRDEKTGTVRGV